MSFQPIHELVASAIERFPDNIAIQGQEASVSYRELGTRVSALLAKLYDAGVAAETVVPILTHDRAELVTAVLALFELGAVAVPLDPGTGRLSRALAGIPVDLCLVGSGVSAAEKHALSGIDTPTLDLGGPYSESAGAQPTPHPYGHKAKPDDPCTIFFTSGTTATPKAILGRLSGIDHVVRWETSVLSVTPEWRVAQMTSPSFDAVLREIFVPLSVGATACIPPQRIRLDPGETARWLDREQIDLIHSVPSVFRGVLDAARREGIRWGSLRCAALSGEQLLPADARSWFEVTAGRPQLLNLYGPTETSMIKTFHIVRPQDGDALHVPVGTALPETDVIICDQHGEPLAAGGTGEVYLRTPHRSLGYVGRAEDTARAFVEGPRGNGDIVYRTGDIARFDDDGCLVVLGRQDGQLKIGGVRVETAGVEAVLLDHPAVLAAAVVPDGPDQLCAFVELSAPADADDLREHVRSVLPDASVPTQVFQMHQLPRTLSGKVDRRNLRRPAPVTELAAQDLPRTSTEAAVAQIWADALGRDKVGRETNFFDAGGSSMMVIQLLTRLSAHFGVEVPLRRFLTSPVVSDLASSIQFLLLDDGDSPVEDLLDGFGSPTHLAGFMGSRVGELS